MMEIANSQKGNDISPHDYVTAENTDESESWRFAVTKTQNVLKE
jgi:hypothetical protein